jgi:tetratricopeptide (TPR) repeat protein
MRRHVMTALACVLAMLAAGVPAWARQADPLKLVQQGRRLAAEGQLTEALGLYDRASELDPTLFAGHLAAGMVLDLLGKYPDARSRLTKAIELAPADARVNALNAMAVSYAFESRADDGAPFYQQAYDLRSTAGRLSDAAEEANALGRLYLECGDTAKALQWYRTGYETARRQPREAGSLLDLWTFRWLHAQARIAARSRNAAEARRQVAAAEALVAKTNSLSDQGPTLAYLKGYVALSLGDAKSALAALAGADHEDPFILMLEARGHEQLGQRAAAVEAWRKVLGFYGHSLQNAFARPAATKALGR